jgi:hypothetical protein
MRAGGTHRQRPRAVSLATLVLLCASFAVAIGDGTGSLTVLNRTSHVVRIVIADRTYGAVVPGGQVTYQQGAPATVQASVSYLAGQGVVGSATRTFQFVGGTTTTNTTTVVFACSTGGVVSPVNPSPIHWTVTADTLATH